MTPTAQLKTEHEAIKLMLRVLDEVSARLDAGQPVPPQHLNQITEFIQVFADRCHHGKEEDLLFPAMEEAGIPREGGPIGVMLAEHDIGRNFVRGMREGVARYEAGDRRACSQIADNARGYVNLLRQHIQKEDDILYMMADMHLLSQKQEQLLEQFEKVE
ncbi:MAG: hemerythrin domain-containing protein [Anaerolineae bacterium]